MEADIIVDRENNPKWSWWDIFLVILFVLTVLGFVAMFKKPIHNLVTIFTSKYRNGVLLFLSTFIQDGAIIAGTIFVTRRRGARLKDLGLVKKNVIANIIFGIMGGLALSALIWGMGIIWTLIFGPPPPQNIEETLNNISRNKDLLLPFLSVSLLAPISEELYFRGMIYPVVKARFGLIPGLAISGLFFGAMHLDIYRLIPISAGGALLAYFYEKTGSLVSSIIAHSMWNTVMLLSVFYAVNYLK